MSSPQSAVIPLPVKVPFAAVIIGLILIGLLKDALTDRELKETNMQWRQQKKKSIGVPDWQWPKGSYDPFGRNVVTGYLTGTRFDYNNSPPCLTYPAFPEVRQLVMVGDGGGLEFPEPNYLPTGCDFKVASDVYVRARKGGIPPGQGSNRPMIFTYQYLVNWKIRLTIEPVKDSGTVVPFPPQVIGTEGYGVWLEPSPVRQQLPKRSIHHQPKVASLPVPQTLPDFTPVQTPGLSLPMAPSIADPSARSITRYSGGWQLTGIDGIPIQPAQPQLRSTPTWSEIPWPNATPIGNPAQQPRATLVGVAAMVGKLEEKGAKIGGNTDPGAGLAIDAIFGLIEKVIDLLGSIDPGGSYELTTPCAVIGEPGSIDSPLIRQIPASVGGFNAIMQRVDALADLFQYSKDLRQPVCDKPKPLLLGEWVTVNFESLGPSPASNDRLRKVLRYRDQTFSPLEVHAAHWHTFQWEAGPVCVISKGLAWGVPQVWASSAAEGKRVLGHAAVAAGIDLGDPKHQWVISHSDSPRIGQQGVMAIRRLRNGALMVSKRVGSQGSAEYPIPTG